MDHHMHDSQLLMQKLELEWKHKTLTNGQVILKYLLICLYEQEQFNSLQYQASKNSETQKLSLLDIILHFEHINSREFFNHYCIRKIKAKAQQALDAILQNKFSIILTDQIYSPLQLLQVQAQGQRVVCLNFKPELRRQQILTKKNGLHFAIHDLEHAWEFFHDPTLYKIQIGTFKILLKLEQHDFFQAIKQDRQFKERFHYLISDMNTHWGHTFMYMHAMLVDFCRDKHLNIDQYYQKFCEVLQLHTIEREAFAKLWSKSTEETDNQIINAFVLAATMPVAVAPAEYGEVHRAQA
jgi:hypothetical protein